MLAARLWIVARGLRDVTGRDLTAVHTRTFPAPQPNCESSVHISTVVRWQSEVGAGCSSMMLGIGLLVCSVIDGRKLSLPVRHDVAYSGDDNNDDVSITDVLTPKHVVVVGVTEST